MTPMPTLRLALVPLLLSLSLPQESVPEEPRATTARVRVPVAHDLELSVRDEGAGPPVLLLTGGPGFAGDYFEGLSAALSDRHRVILPDQRGTGESRVSDYEQGFDFATFVADLEAVREHFGFERWSLVGHSWGGLLAMAYAAEHPGRVDLLGLLSPAGIDSSFWGTYQSNLISRLDEESLTALRALRPRGQSLDDMAAYSREANRLMVPAMVADPRFVPELRADFERGLFEPRVALSMRELQSFDLKPRLAGWSRPTVILQGDQDPLGLDTARTTAGVLGAEIHVFENVGHMSYLECPDELERTLGAFLAQATASAGPK